VTAHLVGVATRDCYYGMPGPFAPGAAEALTKLAAELARRA
jgi:hypothetical protein